MSNYLPDNTIIFIHMPKTAGTSFRREFVKNLNTAWVYHNKQQNSDIVNKYLSGNSRKKNCFVKAFIDLGFQAIGGHNIDLIFPILSPNKNYRFVSFFRDPIQRVLSEYYHRCRKNGYSKGLKQYIKNSKTATNCYYSFLSKLNISIYDLHFVGITEMYDDSIILFNKLFDTNLKTRYYNMNKEKSDYTYKVERSNLNHIVNKNSIDIDIYQKAQEIFKQSCTQQKIEV